MSWGYIVNLVTITVKEWIENDTMTYSAALAFYFILSFPALLLFSASIGKFFTDKNTFRSALIGLVPIFWSASNIFRHLKNFLKIAWEPDPNEKIVAFALSAKKSLMYISEAYRRRYGSVARSQKKLIAFYRCKLRVIFNTQSNLFTDPSFLH